MLTNVARFLPLILALGLAACAHEQEPASLLPPMPVAAAPAETGDALSSLRGEIARNRDEINRLRTELQRLNDDNIAIRAELDRLLGEQAALRADAAAKREAPSTPTPKAATKADGAPKSITNDAAATGDTAAVPSIVAPSPTGKHAVHLATYRSTDLARDGWNALLRKHGARLEKFTPYVTPMQIGGAEGTYYRLTVGPLASADAAKALCDALAASHDYCVPTSLSGEALR